MYDQKNGKRYAYPEKAILLIDSLVTDYKHLPGWETGESRANLSVDSLVHYWRSMLVTSPGDDRELWICTDNIVRHFRFVEKNGNGSNQVDVDLRLVNSFGIHNGLSDDKVNELIEDDRHRIWCSSQNGLTCIDPLNDRIYRYYKEDGLPTNKFYWGCHKDGNSNLYFCTYDGLVWFHPDSIVPEEKPKVYLTGLKLFNKPLRPGPDAPLKKQAMFAEHLRLPHDRNFVSFEFAALDFTGSEKLRYRYMLEGLDKEWVDAGSKRMADYPGLRPGRYRFRVIASNSNGVWNTEGASLGVTITPPFWLRWWSFVIEGALLLSILFLIIRLRERNLRIRAAELEQKVEEKTHQILEQRKEVDEMKSRFYTNISHEFRTPLTLLINPIEDVMKQGQEKSEVSKRILSIMHRNARRLQNLINQLLDISRIESGKMELQLSKANLSEFVRVVASSFYSLSESRQIQYQIDIDNDNEISCFDADKTEKVITNLVSNAFKFSEKGGSVSLQLEFVNPVEENHRQAIIKVTDTGKGMEKNQLDKIFDRFYQVSDNDTREAEGSGIGLALTRELVELMHGSIGVESTPGRGTSFKVSFPVSEGCFSEQEIKTMMEGVPTLDVDIEEEHEQSRHPEPVAETQGKEIVLVVEDNPDLRSYITEKFRKLYKVIEAENGEIGLRKALEEIPDLVISDLMMPVMGGVEFCFKLKEHPALNHIPVIMLTAKADKESRIEGLEAAADDYITKPFDSDLLLVRVKNLIRQRNELRKHYERNLIILDEENHTASPLFSKLREIVKLIDAHLDDPEFDLNSMAAQLNISRRGVFRKTKAVTGMTPHELVRIMRMKRATTLLRNEELNVTEVMYRVGMKNPSHFARSFRKYYGVNPGEYKTRETD
jgi:signal transduction histidine kinase/DNA-binding response OmpR family regulator